MTDGPKDRSAQATVRLQQGFLVVQRFRLTVVDGNQAGKSWTSTSERSSIGAHPSNDVVLEDDTASRFHCEVRIDAPGARVKDLGSANGSILDGVPVAEGFLRAGSAIRIGRTTLRFELVEEQNQLPISEQTTFGPLFGMSDIMRTTFATLERAASTEAVILIEGETGTGKEGAAEAIHQASPRKDGPFVVVDCAAIAKELLESELFGHERGAFTGAITRRIGAFESADKGTLFLDEIGELPLDLQPKLLRVLERHTVRRIGGNTHQDVDVRIVAATNRDLRAEVNAGRFRSDLYFRLAVIKIGLPPLRKRADDIPLLVNQILASLNAPREAVDQITSPERMARLQAAQWPGNVRELRNYLEQCLVLNEPLPLGATQDPGESTLPYEEARRRALADFERRYVEGLLGRHNGQVAKAAQAAGLARGYLYRLIRRHGIE